MEKNKSKEVVVGVVSFLALALFFLGISLGKGFKVTSEDKLLKIRFPNSGGIQVSEPVVVNGVKRGTVMNVVNDNSDVLVTVMLDDLSDIKSDAAAKITLLEITGGKKVEIFPGTSKTKYDLKQEMNGSTPPDIAELVTLVGEVSGDAVSLVRRLDTIAASATELLADGKVVNDIRNTMQNASQVTGNLNSFVDKNYNKLENTVTNLNSLSESLKKAVDKHEPGIERIINDIELTLADARGLITSIDSTVSDANIFVDNINTLTGDLKTGDGIISRLMYDKELNNKLDSTFTNLSILLDMINNHGINVNVRLGSRP
ncbi:MAG: MlaD family protein [Candidatus Kapaibacterium sp.]